MKKLICFKKLLKINFTNFFKKLKNFLKMLKIFWTFRQFRKHLENLKLIFKYVLKLGNKCNLLSFTLHIQLWHGQCAFLLYANKPSRFFKLRASDLWILSAHALDVRCSAQFFAMSHNTVIISVRASVRALVPVASAPPINFSRHIKSLILTLEIGPKLIIKVTSQNS